MRAHGTYARYRFGENGGDWRNGCRCFDCSSTAVLYEKQREARKRRGWEPYVDNAAARDHLEWLRVNGVGLRTVAARTGLGRTALQKIVNGDVTRSRPETIRAVLAVNLSAAHGAALIDAGRTWRLLDELVALGHTKGSIAMRLGAATPALQIGRRRVKASTAHKVEALHRELTAERDAKREQLARRKAAERRRAAA
jgi:hypothetical protein